MFCTHFIDSHIQENGTRWLIPNFDLKISQLSHKFNKPITMSMTMIMTTARRNPKA